ncbi:MAG: ComF family protein [Candidatus Kapaibacterium sp.]|nr:MAG: ComF family protein [Candidatus Kapabacteria bacterium]
MHSAQSTSLSLSLFSRMQAFMRDAATASYESIFSVLAPRHCVLCQQVLPEKHWSSFVCQACFDAFPPAPPSESIMAVYRKQFPAESLRNELPLGRIFARFSMAESLEEQGATAMRHLVHLLKYHRLPSLGVELGAILGAWQMAHEAHHSYDALVPVPLHSARARERGYNQAEMLCNGVASAMAHGSVICRETNVIRRRNYTLSQTFLNAKERATNLHNVIVRGKEAERIRGKRVLLVDDVCTTGTTLHYCALALKEAGAAHVDALALAKA